MECAMRADHHHSDDGLGAGGRAADVGRRRAAARRATAEALQAKAQAATLRQAEWFRGVEEADLARARHDGSPLPPTPPAVELTPEEFALLEGLVGGGEKASPAGPPTGLPPPPAPTPASKVPVQNGTPPRRPRPPRHSPVRRRGRIEYATAGPNVSADLTPPLTGVTAVAADGPRPDESTLPPGQRPRPPWPPAQPWSGRGWPPGPRPPGGRSPAPGPARRPVPVPVGDRGADVPPPVRPGGVPNDLPAKGLLLLETR